MSTIKTETHNEWFINWKVVLPYMICLAWGLPSTIVFFSVRKTDAVITLLLFIVGTAFWIKDKWIFSKRLLIINRKDLGDGKTKVDIAREGEGQAGTYILSKDDVGNIGMEGPL